MTVLYRAGDHRTMSVLEKQAERHERLAADLRALARGEKPDLTNAPVLADWRPSVRATPCLEGLVQAHPHLDGLSPVQTSVVEVLDSGEGWARTWSRYYRLGERALRY